MLRKSNNLQNNNLQKKLQNNVPLTATIQEIKEFLMEISQKFHLNIQ